MTNRLKLALRALPASTIVAAALAAPAHAVPVAVDLRVEGASSTIHEDLVTTDGHNVTTAAGGTHKCDGTNGGASTSPAPTLTGAFDDAARKANVAWQGSWNASFEDFLITMGAE